MANDPRRRLLAQVGAHSLHAKRDARETTAAARLKFLASFLDEVDPFGELPEPERIKRADHARRAHMKKLALKSRDARKKRTAAKQKGEGPT